MKTTYLKEYIDYTKKKIAFLPVGTLEWHGNHLPIETDYLVAQKVCEILAEKKSAYMLPPIYLGSGTKKKIDGRWLMGMDKYFKRELPGNLYYLEPKFFSRILINLGNNLVKQGFKKIFVISGHGGRGQMKALALAKKGLKNLTIVNVYDIIKRRWPDMDHADEYETALFWACYPEEERKSRKKKIGSRDDYFSFLGHDPRERASLRLGKAMLKEIIDELSEKIKN